MPLKWYPIDPVLTDQGAFFALADRENAAELKPVALEASATEFQVIEAFQDYMSMKNALELGLGPFGNLSTDVSSVVLTYEVMAYTEMMTTQPMGGEIYGTRWGAGVRLAVAVGQVGGAADLNIGMVAAKTELNMTSSRFRLNVFGVKNIELLRLVPGPGPLDIETYAQILEATTAIKDYMADPDNRSKLESVPISIRMQAEQPSTLMDESRAVVFAMRRISKGKSFAQAEEESLTAGYDARIVRATYQSRLESFEEDARPTNQQRNAARGWLNA
jgi:hypothetical protein